MGRIGGAGSSPASRHDDRRRQSLAPVQHDRRRMPRLDCLNCCLFADRHARLAARRRQRSDNRPVVHLMVLRRMDGCGNPRGQCGLHLSGLRPREPRDRHAVRLLELEQPPERPRAVPVVRHDERARVVVPHADAAGGLHVPREGGPLRQRLAAEIVEVEFVEADLGGRREHPGRGPRGGAPERPALHERHVRALARERPRDPHPGDPAPDDDDLAHSLPGVYVTNSTASPAASAVLSAAPARASPAGKYR